MQPLLIIRNPQMAVLAEASFETWLLDHVRRFFPAVCSQLGEAGTRSFIKETSARARRHGLSEGPDICGFVDLACTFGADFDRALPWAASILAAADGHASTMTMDRLHEAGMEALEVEAAQAVPLFGRPEAGVADAAAWAARPGAQDASTGAAA